jgi:hypothetical protein
VLAVKISTEPVFKAGQPKLLFDGSYEPIYDTSTEGKPFLMIKGPPPEPAARQFNLVLGWFEELKARVPRPGQ